MRMKMLVVLLVVVVGLLLVGSRLEADASRMVCSDLPKAGIVELYPNGTANAMEFVIFSEPFCNGPGVVTATVVNENTAGERVGVQVFGVDGAAVSIQLDAPSNAAYAVYWMAMRGTQ